MRSNRFRLFLAARGRVPRAVSSICLGAAGLGIAGVADLTGAGATPAGASMTSASSPTTLSGTQDLTSPGLSATGGGVTATFDLVEGLSWKQPAQVATAVDPGRIRQGRTPTAKVSYASTGAGTMVVSWTLENLHVTAGDLGTISLGSPTVSANGQCTQAGAGSSCTIVSGTTALIPTPTGYRGPYVNLALRADVTVTTQQLASLRTLVDGGTPGAPVRLLIGATPVADTFVIPCSVGTGEAIGYDLGPLSSSVGVRVLDSLALDVGTAAPSSASGTEAFVRSEHATLSPPALDGSIAVTGPGEDVALGNVLPNNVAPRVSAGGPYSGTQGVPVAFDGSASKDVCGAPTLEWSFSDGGVADGVSPHHTFGSAGLYRVRLTATGATGLTSSTTFTVPVAPLTPVVSAGPDQTTEWGLPVPLSGTSSEPGAGAPPSLADSWAFGDGSGGEGAGATHEYSTPGVYAATLSSCDPSERCSSATTHVTVVQRGTTTAYTGATASDVGGVVTFAASVLDDLGDPVPGVVVDFCADGSATPFTSAVTNSMGFAFASSGFPRGAAGNNGVTARFGGDALYTGSSYGPVAYTVYPAPTTLGASGAAVSDTGTTLKTPPRLATTIAYTGATASTVTGRAIYAASVLDDLGDPVAGVVVDFYADGSSTPFTSAVTNSMGFAFATSGFPRGTVGSHTVTARYAGDARHTGSSYGPLPYTVYQAGSTPTAAARVGTTIAYSGATASAVTGKVIYAASVLDDLGDPVAGGVVDFYADGSPTPFASAVTDSMGFAFATSGFPGGATAIHTVTARLAADARYGGSSYGPVPYTMYADGSP
ncbi:MAG TPA: PKD domain-containing protein [Acidimicrobiales bacterium]|nr:PKD domain-containing protein [Acidimicrobiales bacterium]